MRSFILFCFAFIVFASCENKSKTTGTSTPVTDSLNTPDSAGNFFPVTTYLKGELYNIKNIGITPVKKTTIGGRTDSSFVKTADFEKEFAGFLSPVIDSNNLKSEFEEKKFLDQTLDAFTFTYDPKPGKGANFAFLHWDVYIDPETKSVKRIYLVKKLSDSKEMQLTWQSGKWCKMVTITTGGGETAIEKEEKISWSYDSE